MKTREELIEIAKTIPSLGGGGIDIYNYLMKYAGCVPEGESIIDIGSWLGSTTSFILTAIKKNVQVHCYDKWIADKIFQYKAEYANGLNFKLDEDILKYFKKYLEPWEHKPIYHQGDFIHQTYKAKRKIGLIVDDICTGKEMTDHIMKLFLPSCYPGTIFIFMDFYFYERRRERCRLYQRDFILLNKKRFKFICRPKKTAVAIFKYLGGSIRYPVGQKYLVRRKGGSYLKCINSTN